MFTAGKEPMLVSPLIRGVASMHRWHLAIFYGFKPEDLMGLQRKLQPSNYASLNLFDQAHLPMTTAG